MQDFTDLYLEHSEMAAAVTGVEWADLWRNQVGFLEDEMPFPSPSVFLSYYILNASDTGNKVQNVTWQVDVRLFYETMADTSRGSVNRDSAMSFGRMLTALYKKFHGQSGENFSNMRRIGMGMEDSGNTGYLYKMSFTCISVDYSAETEFNEGEINEVSVEGGSGQPTVDNDPLFVIPD